MFRKIQTFLHLIAGTAEVTWVDGSEGAGADAAGRGVGNRGSENDDNPMETAELGCGAGRRS
jgi:hypothetical protein